MTYKITTIAFFFVPWLWITAKVTCESVWENLESVGQMQAEFIFFKQTNKKHSYACKSSLDIKLKKENYSNDWFWSMHNLSYYFY